MIKITCHIVDAREVMPTGEEGDAEENTKKMLDSLQIYLRGNSLRRSKGELEHSLK